MSTVKEAPRTTPRRRKAVAPSPALDWAAAGWAGLVAGIAYLLSVSTLTVLFTDASSTDAMRRIAAIALGESVLPPPTPFTALVCLAATTVHLPLSLLYARILAVFISGLRAPRAVAVGAVFGAALYALNFYAFTSVFPWFAAVRGWATLLSHVLFGALAAWIYAELTRPERQETGS